MGLDGKSWDLKKGSGVLYTKFIPTGDVPNVCPVQDHKENITKNHSSGLECYITFLTKFTFSFNIPHHFETEAKSEQNILAEARPEPELCKDQSNFAHYSYDSY